MSNFKKFIQPFLGLSPATIFLAFVFVWPVVIFVNLSFYPGSEFSLENYQRIFDPDKPYVRIMSDTFRISILTAVVSILIGYPYTLCIYRAEKKWQKTMLIGFVLLPFWTSLLVRTLAFMQLLQNQGIVNDAMIGLGIIGEPIQMVRNEPGVIIGMTYMLLPYFVLPLYGVVERIDKNLELSARSLGASKIQAFLATVLPLSLPGVVVGATMVFLLSLGFYITPVMLGGGNVDMLSTIIADQISKLLNYSFASALSVVLICATAGFGILLWLTSWFLQKMTASPSSAKLEVTG